MGLLDELPSKERSRRQKNLPCRGLVGSPKMFHPFLRFIFPGNSPRIYALCFQVMMLYFILSCYRRTIIFEFDRSGTIHMSTVSIKIHIISFAKLEHLGIGARSYDIRTLVWVSYLDTCCLSGSHLRDSSFPQGKLILTI